MDAITNGYENAVSTEPAEPVVAAAERAQPEKKATTTAETDSSTSDRSLSDLFEGKKEPSKSTIDSAVSEMNTKLAELSRTRCTYDYDEVTKRVNIKVYDEETEELIREVPPEKSMDMLKKVWELAGMIVDEKR